MKKPSKVIIFLILILSVFPQLKAQKSVPDFDISVGNAIMKTNVFLQSANGDIIAANDTKLYGIDPYSKKVVWESSDFISLTPADVTAIDNSPYIKIERQKALSLAKNKNTYIIESHTGKIVYDSKEEGIKVQNTFTIPELNGLMVESIKAGFLSLSLIDMTTGTTLWTAPIAKVKSGGFGIGALTRAIKSQLVNSNFKTMPLVDATGNVIVAYKKELICLNGKTGAPSWKLVTDDDINEMYLNSDYTSVYIGISKYIDKINTANGKSVLGEPLKMRDELNGLIDMGSDNYLVLNQAGINILEANGKFKWKKDLKLDKISDAKFNNNGILAVQTVKPGEETKLIWIDYAGEKKWDESLKGGLIMSELTDKGVMYVTNERANVLTYEKGKDVWNKDIKIKGYPYFGIDAKNKIVYCFAKDIIHSFNFTDISYKKIAEDLKLRDYNPEKESAMIDIRKDGAGLFINTAQNVAYINVADGKVVYNNYYAEAKLSLAARIGLKTLGVAAGMYGAKQQIKGQIYEQHGANQATIDNGTKTRIQGENINGAANEMFAMANQRHLATQQTKDRIYILSKLEEGTGLAVWDKDGGKELKRIIFNDINPKYIVDEAENMLYVMIDNSIKAYSLGRN